MGGPFPVFRLWRFKQSVHLTPCDQTVWQSATWKKYITHVNPSVRGEETSSWRPLAISWWCICECDGIRV